jgi:hypothetical protein
MINILAPLLLIYFCQLILVLLLLLTGEYNKRKTFILSLIPFTVIIWLFYKASVIIYKEIKTLK